MRAITPPKPIEIDGHAEFEVKQILNSKRVKGQLYYLVDWKGFGPEERSWEISTDVHAPRLVRIFHQRNPDKPRERGPPLRGGTVRITPNGGSGKSTSRCK